MSNALLIHATGLGALALNVVALVCTCERSLRLRSGVALLEKDIVERRPAYRDYVARTNAFIPGPRRREPAP